MKNKKRIREQVEKKGARVAVEFAARTSNYSYVTVVDELKHVSVVGCVHCGDHPGCVDHVHPSASIVLHWSSG